MIQIDDKQRCCGNCRHFYEGECRRYPPQVAVDPHCEHTGNVFYTFPDVSKEEWCGEFQQIEGWIVKEGFEILKGHKNENTD